MFWPQAIACFALWIGYGVHLRTRSHTIRARLQSASRRRRTLYGSVGLIGSALGLLGGLSVIAALGGLTAQGLLPWAWSAVAVLGLAFVHWQTMGAAAMITLIQEEATLRRRASVSTESISEPEQQP